MECLSRLPALVPFRPFAPSILREAVKNWFETDYDVPFMLQVYQIREEKRKDIPAVTHVNGSGRLQTITEKQNLIYYKLIKEFEKIAGVPIVLNTSFNENEPVVCLSAPRGVGLFPEDEDGCAGSWQMDDN